MYIRQKNTGEYEIVVRSGGEQALSQHPDLFEEIEGEPLEGCSFLNFEAE